MLYKIESRYATMSGHPWECEGSGDSWATLGAAVRALGRLRRDEPVNEEGVELEYRIVRD